MKGTTKSEFPDGLKVLGEHFALTEIMRVIELTARWVDPETFRLLPVWYPEHARQSHFYKANWSEPQPNTNQRTKVSTHKQEGNTYANRALASALGLSSGERPNWSCCHIWGVDDASYQKPNTVVQDRRFYSCVANMVLLPTPLKAFTDVMPEVKMLLRVCARNLYGWTCEHEHVTVPAAEVESWTRWDAYPASWPRTTTSLAIPGLIKINDKIRKKADDRLSRIRHDLSDAGPHYPRDQVRHALDFWKIST